MAQKALHIYGNGALFGTGGQHRVVVIAEDQSGKMIDVTRKIRRNIVHGERRAARQTNAVAALLVGGVVLVADRRRAFAEADVKILLRNCECRKTAAVGRRDLCHGRDLVAEGVRRRARVKDGAAEQFGSMVLVVDIDIV